eukprot:TRINITY_DN23485_c0_g1_i1.p1 TRINITY_DN23485_c0_g1~~TRINITY_DN23485_c0_g1_i1.p1  ORF type:complete len:614 (+),score=98.60 TRINITY_DN23485_c0_g1_i1:109-1950(+)
MSRSERRSGLVVPAVPGDVRAEETLFNTVEKLVGAAAFSARHDHLKNAATSLRRAHSIASKRAEDGLLAGRVARASVSVQYCALLSKFGRHTPALKEAVAAAREAEEVWSILMQAAVARDRAEQQGEVSMPHKSPFGVLLKVPPWWIQKAVVVLVQAKQCVALELEWSLVDRAPESSPEEIEVVRDQLIPSMHREAVLLSCQLLAKDHPARLLAERTQAQAKCRLIDETGYGGGYDFPEPVDTRGRLADTGHDREAVDVRLEYAGLEGLPPRDHMRATGDMVATPSAPALPRIINGGWVSPDHDNSDLYGVPSPSEPGGPGGSRPTSAHSGASRPISAHSRPPSAHMSRPQSAARIQQLEDQAMLRPPGTAWPEEILVDENMLHLLPISSWVDSAPTDDNVKANSPIPSSPKDSHLGRDQKKPRGKSTTLAPKDDEGPKDIFSQWVQGNFPKGRKAKTHARMGTEAGMKELKRDMKMESFKLHHHEMPFLSPEDIYANKVVYSSYGRKVMKEANKLYRPERALSSPAQLPATPTNSKKPDWRHAQVMKEVKDMKSKIYDFTEDAVEEENAFAFKQFVHTLKRQRGNSRVPKKVDDFMEHVRSAFRKQKNPQTR